MNWKMIGIITTIIVASSIVVATVYPSKETYCGNIICEDGEAFENCPEDCSVKCGNDICEAGENYATCPKDCNPVCGDGICGGAETEYNCPQDCVIPTYCGDGTCTIVETKYTCSEDCGFPTVCGNKICEYDESRYSCPPDCTVTDYCGDWLCTGNEDCFSCPSDCGYCNAQPIWSTSYDNARKSAGISDEYFVKTPYYDYDSLIIKEAIQEVRDNADDPEDAIKYIAEYTYDNVCYAGSLGCAAFPESEGAIIETCLADKASTVLDKGWGWCSTQSYVNMAILRGAGIAARQVTGCANSVIYCKLISIMENKPFIQTGPVIFEDGKLVVTGFAHSWIQAWIPSKGWVLIESTSGQVYETSCDDYLFWKFPTLKEDICAIDDDIFNVRCWLF